MSRPTRISLALTEHQCQLAYRAINRQAEHLPQGATRASLDEVLDSLVVALRAAHQPPDLRGPRAADPMVTRARCAAMSMRDAARQERAQAVRAGMSE